MSLVWLGQWLSNLFVSDPLTLSKIIDDHKELFMYIASIGIYHFRNLNKEHLKTFIYQFKITKKNLIIGWHKSHILKEITILSKTKNNLDFHLFSMLAHLLNVSFSRRQPDSQSAAVSLLWYVKSGFIHMQQHVYVGSSILVATF